MSLAEELLADLEEQEEEQEDDELKTMIEETNAQQEIIDQEMRDLSQDVKPDNLLKLSAYKTNISIICFLFTVSCQIFASQNYSIVTPAFFNEMRWNLGIT